MILVVDRLAIEKPNILVGLPRSSTQGQRLKEAVMTKTACINYDGCRNTCGYGWRTFRGKQMNASRAAWIELFGDVPKGKQVLHHCDNRACINIKHLYLGTIQDNMRDRASRGRCSTHKITHEQALIIRKSYSSGMKQSEIVLRYHLSSGYVSELVRGKHYNYEQRK